MIGTDTLFILGAGASIPYGFPSGKRLVREICRQLERPDSNSYGKSLIDTGLSSADLIQFALDMASSASPSVEAFLEHRPDYEKIGKRVIAAALIRYEVEDELKSDDWYQYFFQALNIQKESFNSNRVTIVTFNYDRSLEWFMLQALKAKYGISQDSAETLLRNIDVIHVYGMLSPLSERAYSPRVDNEAIEKAAANIKIVHESSARTDELTRANQILTGCPTIFVLGFGFHRMNMGRLDWKMSRGGNVYCSRYLITDGEWSQISMLFPKSQLLKIFAGETGDDALHFLRKVGVLPLS